MQKLLLKNEDRKIPIQVQFPKIPTENIPVVIFCHDFLGSKNEVEDLFQKEALFLANNGYASVCFDYPGCGSRRNETVEDYYSFLSDTYRVINYCLAEPKFDRKNVHLLGFGFGARSASYALSVYKDNIASATFWNPDFSDGKDLTYVLGSNDYYFNEAKKNGEVKVSKGMDAVTFKEKFFHEICFADPVKCLHEFNNSQNFIIGTKNAVLNEKLTEDLINNLKNEKKKINVSTISDAGHTFNIRDSYFSKFDELSNATLSLLNNSLRVEKKHELNTYEKLQLTIAFSKKLETMDNNVSDIIVDENVDTLIAYSFSKFKNLNSVTLSDALEIIFEKAFCESTIREINFNNNLATIKEEAFASCNNLTKIELPKSLKFLGHSAFKDCKNLKMAFIPSTLETISPNVFVRCSSLREIKFDGTKEDLFNITGGKNFYDEYGPLISFKEKTIDEVINSVVNKDNLSFNNDFSR